MQLYDILSCSNKFTTVNDLYIHIDLIIDLARDDVQKITHTQKKYFFDFDTVYFLASKVLKKQLRKTHLCGVRRFFQCENIEQATHWLVSRLLNNMLNLNNRAYLDYVDINIYQNEVYENQFYFHSELDFDDLNKLSRNTIEGGLKKIYSDVLTDHEFDLVEFEELCFKYNFESIEIIGYDPRQAPPMKAELTESGNSQLTLFF